MSISKKTRELVFEKFNRHCAYCGRVIELSEMQVDHFISQKQGGSDELYNLMPACRMCNHYKRAHTLEVFRQYISEIPRKLQQNYIYKIGVVYGNIIENKKTIQFYFEQGDQDDKSY